MAVKRSRSKGDKQQEADSGKGQNGDEQEVARFEQDLAGYLEQRIKPGLNRGAIPLLARSIAKEIAQREYPNGASEAAEADDEESLEADDEESLEADDEESLEADDEESLEADDEDSLEADDEDSLEADDEDSLEADDEDSLEADDEDSLEADDEDSLEADDEDSLEADDEDSLEADDEDSLEADDEDSLEADDEDNAEGDDEDSAESMAPDFEADMHELQGELGEDWIVRFSVQGGDAWLTAEKDDGSQRVEAPTGSVLAEVVGLLNERGGRST